MSRGKHLNKDQREAIQNFLGEGRSASYIARALSVSVSTITREVRNNRSLQPTRRKLSRRAVKCKHYNSCLDVGTACEKCASPYTPCAKCKTKVCIDTCKSFEEKTCSHLDSWPYICSPVCPSLRKCFYTKAFYDGKHAHETSKRRQELTKSGAMLGKQQLQKIAEVIHPRLKQGHSLSAVYTEHGEDISVSLRTLYNYQEKGYFNIPNLDYPKIIRYKKRKTAHKKSTRDNIDRAGREYADFIKLNCTDRLNVVEMDSVEGFSHNKQRLLSLHFKQYHFQFFQIVVGSGSYEVVRCLDAIEFYLGSVEKFKELFGTILCDRGVEFSDWKAMERSSLSPGKNRCKVFYCDPRASQQKGSCERNHVELRRILPKGRSDFDKLSQVDVAIITSHISSYPRPALKNKCPLDVIAHKFPPGFLDVMGIEQIPLKDVILKPALMQGAVRI